jgi:hypothetical protein
VVRATQLHHLPRLCWPQRVDLRSTRRHSPMNRHGAGCIVVLLVSLSVGCSAGAGSSGSDEQGATPQAGSVSATTGGFGARRVTLTCADAEGVSTPGSTPVHGLTVGDVTFGGLKDPSGTVPRAEDVGLVLPNGLHWYFRKAPLTVRADAMVVTIHIAGSRQALAWVPAAVWTAGTPVVLSAWAARSVTVNNCANKDTWFLGGILAAAPNPCLALRVRSRGSRQHTIRWHLNGTPCHG